MHPHQSSDSSDRGRDTPDRRNRFASSGVETPRSASQPPTTNGGGSDGYYATSPAMQIYGSPGRGGLTSPWSISSSMRAGGGNGNGNGNGNAGGGRAPSLTRSSSIGIPTSFPRASSFSASAERAYPSSSFASHAFPSTFEDDETSDVLSDSLDYQDPSTPSASGRGDDRDRDRDHDRLIPTSLPRGRNILPGDTRSRSQSLATTTTRPLPIGSPLLTHPNPNTSAYSHSNAHHDPSASWTQHTQGHAPQGIPINGGGRYGEIRPPTSSGGTGSRYGSLGALARSPIAIHGASSSPTGLRVGSSTSSTGGDGHGNGNENGNGLHRNAEISNISPFVRDVGQILLDDGSAYREVWGVGVTGIGGFGGLGGLGLGGSGGGGGGGMGSDNFSGTAGGAGGDGGPPSGTASRRHSVSVVQPRRGVVGFNAPDRDSRNAHSPDGPRVSNAYAHSFVGSGMGGMGGGLMISDDDLAVGLNMLNLGPGAGPGSGSGGTGTGGGRGVAPTHSQPSSLPIYAPLSRASTSASSDVFGGGESSSSANLSIPSRNVHSPSESGYSGGSGGGGSPQRSGETLGSHFSYQQQGQQGQHEGSTRPRPAEIRTDLSPTLMHRAPGVGSGIGAPPGLSQHQARFSVGMQYFPEAPGSATAGNPNANPNSISVSPTYVRSGPGPNQSFMQIQSPTSAVPMPLPGAGGLGSPLSPTGVRGFGGQHFGVGGMGMGMGNMSMGGGMGGMPMPVSMPVPMQRRASQSISQPPDIPGAGPGGSNESGLAELGKGVPLHSVPSSWSLFIVEFKAGRTDLFYVTDPNADIRVGDLVIVEADRGKDLGKVVNDTITAAEVEAFQRQQQAVAEHQRAQMQQFGGGIGGSAGGDGEPGSPERERPPPHGKKEINPKKIYGKATSQDTQYVYLFIYSLRLRMKFNYLFLIYSCVIGYLWPRCKMKRRHWLSARRKLGKRSSLWKLLMLSTSGMSFICSPSPFHPILLFFFESFYHF